MLVTGLAWPCRSSMARPSPTTPTADLHSPSQDCRRSPLGLVCVLRGPSPAAEGSQNRGLLGFSTVPTRGPHHTPWGPIVPYASVGGLPFTLDQGVLPLFSYLTSSC